MVKDDTTEEMWKQYQDGATLKVVGDRYGITREAVRLRFKKAGYQTRSRSEADILRRSRREAEFGEQLGQALKLWRDTPDNVETIAQEIGLTPSQVRAYILANTTKAQRRTRHQTVMSIKLKDRVLYTDEELLDAIRACAEYLGRTPGIKTYGEFAKSRNLPTTVTIQTRFVSWNDAVTEAGFTPHDHPNGIGLATYSDEDYESALRRVAEIVGYKPSIRDYYKYRQSNEPHGETFRQRYGGWNNALQVLL